MSVDMCPRLCLIAQRFWNASAIFRSGTQHGWTRWPLSNIAAERGELTALDNEVLESLRQQEILSRNPEEELQAGLTTGQR